jgi:DNA-binding Lrp family transcriptional regulator
VNKYKLDRIDIRILSSLQTNGRMTNTDLAAAVALSPSPCLARVKRLEKEGYILGYNAQIDLAKLGPVTTVFTEITLEDHHKMCFANFERNIKNIPEIAECHLISGGYDYLLKFQAQGVAAYQGIMEDILERETEFGVAKYFSYIVIKSPVERQNFPLAKLFSSER